MSKIHKLATLACMFLMFISCAQEDKIIGVWEVKNEYYQGVFEIVPYKGKFFGKVHYYNDGTTEYKGTNKEEDYFLTDIELKDGHYINGKMYMPGGSQIGVVLKLLDDNRLQVNMKVQGQDYTEIWTRKKKG